MEPNKLEKIQRIVNCFETGKPELDVKTQFAYEDGPQSVKQLTIGSGITEFGNLHDLVKLYLTRVTDNTLSTYLPYIGKEQLVNDKIFTTAIREASKTKEWYECYELIWQVRYIDPAIKWAKEHGIVTPLGILVVYDSMIHSGSVPLWLRNRFTEPVPSNGGSEIKWLKDYCTVRRGWLKNHNRKILNKTVYRMDNILSALQAGDMNLEKEFNANGTKVI